VGWILLAQDRDQWMALVNTVMKLFWVAERLAAFQEWLSFVESFSKLDFPIPLFWNYSTKMLYAHFFSVMDAAFAAFLLFLIWSAWEVPMSVMYVYVLESGISIYLWLYNPFVGPWPLFQFLDVYTQSVGLLGRGSARRKAATCTHDSTNTE
jgi:hypothetical protein